MRAMRSRVGKLNGNLTAGSLALTDDQLLGRLLLRIFKYCLTLRDPSLYRHSVDRARKNIIMAKCEVCENDYDKTFEVVPVARATFLTASSARSTPLPPLVHIASAALSATAWNRIVRYFAASTARATTDPQS